MIYKSVVDYEPKTKKMAAAIEKKANEMLVNGYELVTFSITNSAKAILVFKSSEEQSEDDTISTVAEAAAE